MDTQQYQIDKCKGNFFECKKGRGTGSMLREMGRRSIKKIIEDKLFWPLLCFFLSLCAKCSHFLHTQHALIFIHSLTDTHTHTHKSELSKMTGPNYFFLFIQKKKSYFNIIMIVIFLLSLFASEFSSSQNNSKKKRNRESVCDVGE